ncbi:MAG: sulfite exporter TauE/SafE family protein [Spirochaetota bacterium]
MDILHIILLAALYAASSFVQGLTGFGMALIAAPILALAFDPQTAVGMVVGVGVSVGIYNFILHRRHVEYRRVFPLALASYPLVPVGAYFLENVEGNIVMIALGAVVILMTAFSVLIQSTLQTWMRRPGVGYLFSAISGLFLGAFSTSGPPVVAYFYTGDHDRMRAKANTQFFFAATAAAALITHVAAANITAFTLVRSLPFLPVVLLGTWAGAHVSGRLPTHIFHRATDVFLVALGAYLILGNL